MDVWATIPVKSLLEGKGRLAHLLPPESRAALVGDLLNHVLKVVSAVPEITHSLVVSSDPAVWDIAEANGALALPERAPLGLNRAVTYAYDLARKEGADAVLVLPADLPLVTTADIEQILDAGLGENRENGSAYHTMRRFGAGSPLSGEPAQPLMTICPDRRGDGTNALLLQPPVCFCFHYGPSSLRKHIQEALERDFAVRLVTSPGLLFDLDTQEDWYSLEENDRHKRIRKSTIHPSIK